jgi:hypothetical protein
MDSSPENFIAKVEKVVKRVFCSSLETVFSNKEVGKLLVVLLEKFLCAPPF